jgi:hypothetical protein
MLLIRKQLRPRFHPFGRGDEHPEGEVIKNVLVTRWATEAY